MYHISSAHTDVTRATVVAHRSFVRGSHVRPSRTRAVKASQSSFHPCSLHGRTNREYAAIRKEIKSEERPTNGLDTPGIYITLMRLCICTYVKSKGKTYSRSLRWIPRTRFARMTHPQRSTSSAWHVRLRFVTRHAA